MFRCQNERFKSELINSEQVVNRWIINKSERKGLRTIQYPVKLGIKVGNARSKEQEMTSGVDMILYSHAPRPCMNTSRVTGSILDHFGCKEYLI